MTEKKPLITAGSSSSSSSSQVQVLYPNQFVLECIAFTKADGSSEGGNVDWLHNGTVLQTNNERSRFKVTVVAQGKLLTTSRLTKFASDPGDQGGYQCVHGQERSFNTLNLEVVRILPVLNVSQVGAGGGGGDEIQLVCNQEAPAAISEKDMDFKFYFQPESGERKERILFDKYMSFDFGVSQDTICQDGICSMSLRGLENGSKAGHYSCSSRYGQSLSSYLDVRAKPVYTEWSEPTPCQGSANIYRTRNKMCTSTSVDACSRDLKIPGVTVECVGQESDALACKEIKYSLVESCQRQDPLCRSSTALTDEDPLPADHEFPVPKRLDSSIPSFSSFDCCDSLVLQWDVIDLQELDNVVQKKCGSQRGKIEMTLIANVVQITAAKTTLIGYKKFMLHVNTLSTPLDNAVYGSGPKPKINIHFDQMGRGGVPGTQAVLEAGKFESFLPVTFATSGASGRTGTKGRKGARGRDGRDGRSSTDRVTFLPPKKISIQ